MQVFGIGIELNSPQHEMFRHLQPVLRNMLPTLTEESDGLVYPIFFDVRGKCVVEQGGTSQMNFHNIAFIVDTVQNLLSKSDLKTKASGFGNAYPSSSRLQN